MVILKESEAQEENVRETHEKELETKGLSRAFGFGIGLLKKKVFNLGITVLSGGTSKLLTITGFLGGKFVSFLSGVFAGEGAPETADSLKKISLAVAVFLILPIFLILLLGFFDMGILRPTAIVDQYQKVAEVSPSITEAPGVPTPTLTSGTTPSQHQPTLSEEVPQGFPIASSCVSQTPSGSYNHKEENLNAIDLAAIALYDAFIVRATHPGTVILARDFAGYGLTVILESLDRRYITYYGHLSRGSISVRVGQQIDRETQLGIADNTGRTTGPHLHYELRGPRNSSNPWGSKEGEFGRRGTILNFIPNCKTWSCGGC